MAIYALTSLSGAPGVTTTALAWARLSPRPTLLVEADPTGGSPALAIAFAGGVAHDHSLLALAGHPASEFVQRLWELTVQLPTDTGRGGAWLAPAIGFPAQAESMRAVWAPLGDALHQISSSSDVDVLIDLGRYTSAGQALSLLDRASATLVLTDATLAALNTLHVTLPTLQARLDASGTSRRLAVVPVLGNEKGATHRPYTPSEIQPVVPDVTVLPGITRDARAATGESRRPGAYQRSITNLHEAARKHAQQAAEYVITGSDA